MGKRMAIGISGITRFLGALRDPEPDVQPQPDKIDEKPLVDREIQSANEDPERPPKKRRILAQEGFISGANKKEYVFKPVQQYNAGGLAPHYSHPSQVPEHLQKYYAQRLRLFSLYSEPPGCLLDEEGWYSVTPEAIANQIAERCRCDTILDAFCGVGGNAIAFAKTCQRVITIDNSPTRLALARHNAQIYGVADRIEFILGDYISFARSYIRSSLNPSSLAGDNSARKIDIVFLSPPWGGPSYLNKNQPDVAVSTSASSQKEELITPPWEMKGDADEDEHPTYSLASIKPIHGAELFKLSRQITNNIAFYLPRNTSVEEISALLSDEPGTNSKPSLGADEKKRHKRARVEAQEVVEVEEEWMGNKLKALTCYFGGLAGGQVDLY